MDPRGTQRRVGYLFIFIIWKHTIIEQFILNSEQLQKFFIIYNY